MPDFVIIGAQKAGTTSLHNYLVQHPQVAPLASPLYTKEIHYFDIHYSRGINWYRAFFPTQAYMTLLVKTRNERIITGEACPYYLFHPLVVKRFNEVLPSSKVIVLLRNPVDRAYSHYQHEVRKGWETLSFEEAVQREEERLAGEAERLVREPGYYSQKHRSFSYLARGRYLEQLRPWIECVGRDRCLIIKSEELYRRPEAVLTTAFAYLDISPFNETQIRKKNAFEYEPLDPQLRERLTAYFEPYNQALYDYLGIDLGWEHASDVESNGRVTTRV